MPERAALTRALNLAFQFRMFQHRGEIADFCNSFPWPQTVIEIGAHRGGTAVLFLELGAHVVSVDLPEGPWGGLSHQETEERIRDLSARYGDRFRSVLGDSRKLETKGNIPIRGQVDLLFIDGDHSYEGVRSDYEMYRSFVKPGGLIAFHDIKDSPFHREKGVEVARFWRELRESGQYQSIYEFANDQPWGGIGVVVV